MFVYIGDGTTPGWVIDDINNHRSASLRRSFFLTLHVCTESKVVGEGEGGGDGAGQASHEPLIPISSVEW